MSHSVANGHCLCGQVRFSFAEPPLWCGYCHCESCRRNTGAVVATFIGVDSERFQRTGPVASYASSPGVIRDFCRVCGTPLTYRADRFPGETHIYLSTLDEPDRFKPEFHVFCAEKIAWFDTNDKLPRHVATTTSATGDT
ncbi:MAG: GFA family protein [Gammaproteobacteria bacterium]|nr:GFA family protein [Gammaproteobacteria bacterium]